MGYAPPGTNPTELIELAQEAERLGYDSAWAAEAWGTDAVTVLAWLGATTTTIKLGTGDHADPRPDAGDDTAMTAATLDLMSGGRFLLGLGTSGPQVVEGWHGEPFGKPLGEHARVRRDRPRRDPPRDASSTDGEHYEIPYRGAGRDRLGKPLKLMLRPAARRDPDLPRRDRAEERRARRRDRRRLARRSGSRPSGARDVSGAARSAKRLRHRRLRRPGRDLRRRPGRARRRQAALALYVGGMGAQGQNYYNDARRAVRLRGARRSEIQELYLGGKKMRGDRRGPRRARRRGRARRRRASGSPSGSTRGGSRGVTTLLVQARDAATLRDDGGAGAVKPAELFDLTGKVAIVTGGGSGHRPADGDRPRRGGRRRRPLRAQGRALRGGRRRARAELGVRALGLRLRRPRPGRGRRRSSTARGRARRRRRPRQQRRHRLGRARRGHAARGLAEGDRRQPDRRLPLRPGGRPRDDRAGRRQDREHRLGRRPSAARRPR